MPEFRPFTATEAKTYIEDFLGRRVTVSIDIEAEWYQSGQQDFSLYEGEEYLIYLLKGHAESRDHTTLAVRYLRELGLAPSSLIDCGTGLGFFAATLAIDFPRCRVVATNVDGLQLEFNTWLFERLRLSNLEVREASRAEGTFDAILALEYFEHFKRPAEELRRLAEQYRPKTLVESSSFSHKAMGHFDEYEIGGATYVGPKEGGGAGSAYRQFTKSIAIVGFQSFPLKSNGWTHGRPRIWRAP